MRGMSTRSELLRLLADGGFRSGTDMGRQLGVTRAAVCKAVRSLTDAGLEIHRVTGRGYRLAQAMRLLDRRRILRYLAGDAAGVRDRLTILEEVDSTNRYLLERAAEGQKDTRGLSAALHGGRFQRPASRDTGASLHGAVCLAESQPQGRGRRGRAWIATPYSNLMLSMGWRFASGPSLAAGLSLAAGVALVRALEEYGVTGVGLKWPNDVLWEGRKLAGLLVDVQGEAAGPSLIVLGAGVNAHIGGRDAARIDQPWVDLRAIRGETIDRNRLAALVIRHFTRMFETFAEKGFAAFHAEWQRHHLYHGRRVRLVSGGREGAGLVEGVDGNGALLIRDARGRTQAYHSGEISLRQAA